MECNVLRCESSLVVFVEITPPSRCSLMEKDSEKYSVCDVIVVQLKHITLYNNGSYKCFDFVSLQKKDESDTLSYSVSLSSPEIKIEKIFKVDDSEWRMINGCLNSTYSFTISASVQMITQLNPFAKLYDDLKLTDFTLKCEDGSVDIHKAVLAAFSTQFRAKISEVNENEAPVTSMDIPNTNMNTLEDFKRALYMNVLPENNLKHLLLLASFFKLNVLEIQCVDKILNKLKANEIGDLLDFSLKHNNIIMLLGILEQVQSGVIKVSEIRKYYLSQ